MSITIKESEIASANLRPFQNFLLLAPGGNPGGDSIHQSRYIGSDEGVDNPAKQLFITSDGAFGPALVSRVRAAVELSLKSAKGL
ncbi:hypothetical protein [Variovorax paradoxus]|jgi:hypothetical protein|uniref:hypothetical protein n=1 Tax=Variovorax paradoxus TaxID=34073 RepID=UPI0009C0F2A6|nr:hypothetical protein [Variovorax paradoxus]